MADTSMRMRAAVLVEIEVGTWSDDTNLREIRAQLRREARQIITGKLGHGARIIGEPTITAIMVEEAKP